jgi:hypothetical protein
MDIINVSRKVAGHSFRIRTVNKLNEENRTFLKKKREPLHSCDLSATKMS